MPGMNGIEVVKKLRSTSTHKNTPFIFITGYADPLLETEMKKMEPAAVLHKPFDVQDLLQSISKIIGN